MKEKIIQFLARISFGPVIGNAVMVLQLIMDAVQNKESRSLARYVYAQLPKRWKEPEGPATEQEFLSMIKAGEKFMTTLHQVTVK